MVDFEKLGLLYLGRVLDPATQEPTGALLLEEARDLTTHAVILGMTGSGKTGLAISLLEEAAIDGIPAIAIDPKGDLANLALAFPELRTQDFRPWIDEGKARRAGMDPEAFASKLATTWSEGLASWGQDGARIARFRDAAELAIYTPGSSAGLGLSILRSLAPPADAPGDREAINERVEGAVSALLGLIGIEADPLRSREHVWLSQLVLRAWSAGRALDLAQLVREIQDPGLDRVGVLDLESYYPARERADLALGRATTAARGVGRTAKEREDVGDAEAALEAVRSARDDLEATLRSELEALAAGDAPVEPFELPPRKSDTEIETFVLAWAPWWIEPQGAAAPAWYRAGSPRATTGPS